MKALKDSARRAVLGTLAEIVDEGQVKSSDINDNLSPIRDLGLDSADGIYFACILSEKLRVDIAPEFNPFVDDSKPKRRARRIGEIIEIAVELLSKQEEFVDD